MLGAGRSTAPDLAAFATAWPSAERVVPAGEGSDNVLAGRIRSHLYLGARHQYIVDVGGPDLRVELPEELPSGEVRLHVPPHAATLLSTASEPD